MVISKIICLTRYCVTSLHFLSKIFIVQLHLLGKMDVNNDLLRQFNSLCTTDKENLVKGLRELIGDQLTESAAVFFLEMNDWSIKQ